MKAQFLNDLNKNQRVAAETIQGPVLILAGAGSGKTKTMTYRIGNLIHSHGINASNILGLSFTNKAAAELKERVISLVGKNLAKGATISTFHRLAILILRMESGSKKPFVEFLGFRRNFTIVDQGDQLALVKRIMKHIHIDDKAFDAWRILSMISNAKSDFLTPEKYRQQFYERPGAETSDYEEMVTSIYPEYQRALSAQNAFDFDDLIFKAVTLLESNMEARSIVQDKYKFVMVDEYQDTNLSQFKLLEIICENHHNICVVGDDDQSIYAWRGADPSHILNFPRKYKNCKKIVLDQNYRSTNTILNAANSVIKNNQSRYEKSLWSAHGEGKKIQNTVANDQQFESQLVAEKIKELNRDHQIRYDAIGVLFRSNALSRSLEGALRIEKIPYEVVGGQEFYSRKEVKDFIAYLKAIVNPWDESSVRRIINLPARGIGDTTIKSIDEWGIAHGVSFLKSLTRIDQIESVNDRSKESIQKFLNLMRTYSSAFSSGNEPISVIAGRLMKDISYEDYLRSHSQNGDKARIAIENVNEVINGIAQFESKKVDEKKNKLTEYLNFIGLESEKEDEQENTNKNMVTLMTIHSSKGLEFDTVFLIGCEEGVIPHRHSIELNDISEERRLFYVALTRAKRQLFLSRPAERVKYGKKVEIKPSRFLLEIPEEYLDLHDHFNQKFTDQQAHNEKVRGFISDIFAVLDDA